ncbi:MAG: phosphopantothenate--cysteine ligase [Clostridiales Family XIII bacterium]|jgi:phosphopantothenate-cysteine ligase|nr:phosphopantothenate--cysteine ligase [Clostridiales Family XIII bacterium]
MKNILITAGGTSERIDNVRSVTNMSTGKLGRCIAEDFARRGQTRKIWYLCGKQAALPHTDKAEILPVESTADLADAVTRLCARETIDVVVHAMAVSDYAVRAVSSAGVIAEEIERRVLQEGGPDTGQDAGRRIRSAAAEAMRAAPGYARDGKIPSNVDDLVIFMQRTPKILPLFRALLPDAVLVGFKLLDGAAEGELIDVAFRLLQQNGCDFVLANDLKEISGDRHAGYLLRRDKSHTAFTSKEEIARGIADQTLAERERGK